MRKELGDFQTPAPLVEQILKVLSRLQISWTRLLEPTCGMGNFIKGAMEYDSFSFQEVKGIEIQAEYVNQARLAMNGLTDGGATIKLLNDNIFLLNLNQDVIWQDQGPLLILGNPPWVTNSELSKLGSSNLPKKRNLKGLSGFDALTGGSNFDIAEYIILKLIWELSDQNPSIAMLCKNSVARNVLLFAAESNLPIKNSYLRRIDAKRWFDAAVDACLFYIDIEKGWKNYDAPVYPSLEAELPNAVIGVRGGKLVADIKNYAISSVLDGKSPIDWRQGLKHDAATVMELSYKNGIWTNKLGEQVSVERERIYPLLKSSDLYHGRTQSMGKGVIVTQKILGGDTSCLAEEAPMLWDYLQRHKALFTKRKSSIYRNRPDFSIFGVGDYTFAPFKVGISGLHKTPRFRLITPLTDQPVILDDTCYFVPCNSLTQAALITVLLDHPITQSFLDAVSFSDSKRPITKKLLQRLNLAQLLEQVGALAVIELAKELLAKSGENHEVSDAQWVSAVDVLFVEYSKDPLLL